MLHFFTKFIYHKYYHWLCGRSLEDAAVNVNIFREALWKYVCFDSDGNQDINLPLELFRPFGWIDCMQHFFCAPGSGPINREDDRRPNRYNIQKAFFTRYSKGWGMKTQVIIAPNGMIISTFFTSILQNDKGAVNISGIEEELDRLH